MQSIDCSVDESQRLSERCYVSVQRFARVCDAQGNRHLLILDGGYQPLPSHAFLFCFRAASSPKLGPVAMKKISRKEIACLDTVE